jgi:hypothetical protein
VGNLDSGFGFFVHHNKNNKTTKILSFVLRLGSFPRLHCWVLSLLYKKKKQLKLRPLASAPSRASAHNRAQQQQQQQRQP